MKSLLREILPVLPSALALGLGAVFIVCSAYIMGKAHGAREMKKIFDEVTTIHHPEHGDYPRIVPYHEGMTLLPGQTAIVEVPLERWQMVPPDRPMKH